MATQGLSYAIPPASAGGPFLNPPIRPVPISATVNTTRPTAVPPASIAVAGTDVVEDYQSALEAVSNAISRPSASLYGIGQDVMDNWNSVVESLKDRLKDGWGGFHNDNRFSGGGQAPGRRPFGFSGGGDVDQSVMDQWQAVVATLQERLDKGQDLFGNDEQGRLDQEALDATAAENAFSYSMSGAQPLGFLIDPYNQPPPSDADLVVAKWRPPSTVEEQIARIHAPHFDQMADFAYAAPNGVALRRNPDDGQYEMFVAGTRTAVDWGANLLETIGGYQGINPEAVAYRQDYVRELEDIALRYNVKRVYGHSRAAALVAQMTDSPQYERIGLDGAMILTGNENKNMLNLTTAGDNDNKISSFFDGTIAKTGTNNVTLPAVGGVHHVWENTHPDVKFSWRNMFTFTNNLGDTDPGDGWDFGPWQSDPNLS